MKFGIINKFSALTTLILVIVFFSSAAINANSSNKEIENSLSKVNEVIAEYDRVLASFKSMGEQSFQHNVDDFIAYSQQLLEQERYNFNLLEGLMSKEEAVLRTLPELNSFNERMTYVNQEIRNANQKFLALLSQQLDITYRLKYAYQAQDVSTWNSLVAQKNQLISEANPIREKIHTNITNQRTILVDAKTALTQAIAVAIPPTIPLKTDSPKQLTNVTETAKKLVPTPLPANSPYKSIGAQTQCSRFVRDLAKEFVGKTLPELDGNVSAQVTSLTKLAGQQNSKWSTVDFNGDNKAKLAAFKKAQDLANQGKLVLVAWKNPKPTPANSGHIAAIVPAQNMEESGKWGIKVPYIAQAGETISSKMKLSDGFNPAMKSSLMIFVYDK